MFPSLILEAFRESSIHANPRDVDDKWKFCSTRFSLGQPGVDAHVRHEGESACAVIQIEFLTNEGAIVTVTADDTIHYWNFQKKIPVVVHCLKFQRER